MPNSEAILAERFDERSRFSMGSAVTGLIVTLGTVFLIAAVTVVITSAAGFPLSEVLFSDPSDVVVIGFGVAGVIGTFLAFLWGGYTAGRMSGVAGIGHGLAIVGLFILLTAAFWVAGVVTGAASDVGIPFTPTTISLAIQPGALVSLLAFGAGAVVAAIIGVSIGGALGVRRQTMALSTQDEYDRSLIDLRDPERMSRPSTTR